MAEVAEIPLNSDAQPHMPADPLLESRRPRKVYSGMWGPTEIGALGAALVVLAGVIVFYVIFVGPSNREVVRNRSEADRLEAEKISATAKYGDITTTQDQVVKLLRSADDFETRFLPPPSNGLNALYQRLNGLIAAYNLTNTSGPEYQPLQTIGREGGPVDQQSGKERYRSLFPGVYVTMTLEGSYQNLRRFIREIETGNEFIVVSSVELAPSDNEQKKDRPAGQTGQTFVTDAAGNIVPAQAQPAVRQRPRGKTHGDVVSLRMEMAAYFRRPNFTPMAPEVSE